MTKVSSSRMPFQRASKDHLSCFICRTMQSLSAFIKSSPIFSLSTELFSGERAVCFSGLLSVICVMKII